MTAFSIAIGQIIISLDIAANSREIRRTMVAAHNRGARLVQFAEGALSGYAKAQISDWATVDWCCLQAELEAIAALAGQLKLWIVLGSAHRLTDPNLPHNSLYIIRDDGTLLDRYDKRFCSNSELNGWYAPGFHPIIFDIDGYRFGCALCLEVQFPEIFSVYEQLGVDCVLHSTYAPTPIFALLAQAHAEMNCIWLSIANAGQCADKLPSQLIGPNGQVLVYAEGRADASLVVGTLDRADPMFDIALTKARPWRRRARAGQIYREQRVDDPRSVSRDRW